MAVSFIAITVCFLELCQIHHTYANICGDEVSINRLPH